MSTGNAEAVSNTVASVLTPHLDDSDLCDYISSLLLEEHENADARDAVAELIAGAIDDANEADLICQSLFEQLARINSAVTNNESQAKIAAVATNNDTAKSSPGLRKLDQAVSLQQQHNVQTSTTTAETAAAVIRSHDDPVYQVNVNKSERARRKARQKELREQQQEQERQRAIQLAVESMMDDATASGADSTNADAMHSLFRNNSRPAVVEDVHWINFDLPNLRGGGPDLLQQASLTLAAGRRYGLVGRNGCGKTTLLTALSQNKEIFKNNNMLLVRQEIVGNHLTAVETVLKANVQRESLERWIEWCLDQLEQLADDTTTGGNDPSSTSNTATTSSAAAGRGSTKNVAASKSSRKGQTKATATAATETLPSSQLTGPQKQQRRKQLNEKLVLAHERLDQMQTDPEPRARKVLAGLGLTTEMQNKPTEQLSGGWRMRVSLSCALFVEPQVLLLDEPTNHLDLEAVVWLEHYLINKFKGTLVVVSHDRQFLNEVVTDVVHFHRNQLISYRGDISNFEAVRRDDKLRQERLREVQEAKRAHLQKYIDLHAEAGENGVKAARQRKSKMKKLDKLGVMAQDGKRWKASYDGDAEEVEEVIEDDKVELKFPDPGSFDGDIVRFEQVTFGYSPDKILLQDVDLSINLKSRVALLGRNGCGKTTMIKLAVAGLRPIKGHLVVDNRAKIEYIAQHQLEQLDPDGTPLQTMVDRYPGDRSNGHISDLRRYLANFGLGGEVLPLQRIHTMSGGQKCRLCLACALYRKPHILVLDEPTNNLDLETIEALIEAIRTFQGGVLLVSHDQHLLTSVCEHLYVVENGRVEQLTKGSSSIDAFNAYKKAIVQGRR